MSKLIAKMDHRNRVVGDTYDEPDPIKAKWYVDNGYADYVKEKKQTTPNDKMVKGSKDK